MSHRLASHLEKAVQRSIPFQYDEDRAGDRNRHHEDGGRRHHVGRRRHAEAQKHDREPEEHHDEEGGRDRAVGFADQAPSLVQQRRHAGQAGGLYLLGFGVLGLEMTDLGLGLAQHVAEHEGVDVGAVGRGFGIVAGRWCLAGPGAGDGRCRILPEQRPRVHRGRPEGIELAVQEDDHRGEGAQIVVRLLEIAIDGRDQQAQHERRERDEETRDDPGEVLGFLRSMCLGKHLQQPSARKGAAAQQQIRRRIATARSNTVFSCADAARAGSAAKQVAKAD